MNKRGNEGHRKGEDCKERRIPEGKPVGGRWSAGL